MSYIWLQLFSLESRKLHRKALYKFQEWPKMQVSVHIERNEVQLDFSCLLLRMYRSFNLEFTAKMCDLNKNK